MADEETREGAQDTATVGGVQYVKPEILKQFFGVSGVFSSSPRRECLRRRRSQARGAGTTLSDQYRHTSSI